MTLKTTQPLLARLPALGALAGLSALIALAAAALAPSQLAAQQIDAICRYVQISPGDDHDDHEWQCDQHEIVEAQVRVHDNPTAFDVWRNGEVIYFRVEPRSGERRFRQSASQPRRYDHVANQDDAPNLGLRVRMNKREIDEYYDTYETYEAAFHDIIWTSSKGWVLIYALTVEEHHLDIDGLEVLSGGALFNNGGDFTYWRWNRNNPQRFSDDRVHGGDLWFHDLPPVPTAIGSNPRIDVHLYTLPRNGAVYGIGEAIYLAVTFTMGNGNSSGYTNHLGDLSFRNLVQQARDKLKVRLIPDTWEDCTAATHPRDGRELPPTCEERETVAEVLELPIDHQQTRVFPHDEWPPTLANAAYHRFIYKLDPGSTAEANGSAARNLNNNWIGGLRAGGVEVLVQNFEFSIVYYVGADLSDQFHPTGITYQRELSASKVFATDPINAVRDTSKGRPPAADTPTLPGPGDPDPNKPIDIVIPHPQPIGDDDEGDGAGTEGGAGVQAWYMNPDPSTIPTEQAFYHGPIEEGYATTPAIGGSDPVDHGGGGAPPRDQPAANPPDNGGSKPTNPADGPPTKAPANKR